MTEGLRLKGISRITAPSVPSAPARPDSSPHKGVPAEKAATTAQATAPRRAAVPPAPRPVAVKPVEVKEPEAFYNPVLDDDDDETYTAPPVVETPKVTTPKAQSSDSGGKAQVVKKKEEPSDGLKSYRRSRLTHIDLEIIEFLYEFGYGSVSQIRALFEGQELKVGRNGKKQFEKTGKAVTRRPMEKRLKGLEAMGLIERKALAVGRPLWFCTPEGQSAIGRSGGPEPKRARSVALSTTEHTLMRNQIAAALIGYERFGADTLNVFSLPKPSGSSFEFVHESFMERAFNKKHKELHSMVDKGVAQVVLRDDMVSRLQQASSADDLLVIESMYPALWTAALVDEQTDKSGKVKRYPDGNPIRKVTTARPDLVFKLPRRTATQSGAIAIELERENKDITDYVMRFKAYANWKQVYRRVYYVLVERDPRRSSLRAHSGLDQRTKILRAIKLAGCEDFIKVVSLRDTDGDLFYDSKSVWEL